MSLLRDIQTEVSSNKGDVVTVLRKCKVLASRLSNPDFIRWVEWELDGYPESQATPPYRRLTVTYFASFLNIGWKVPQAAIPLQIVPEEYRDLFHQVEFREGIAKADSLACGKAMSFERPELICAVQGKMYPEMNCHRVWGMISSGEFEQLLSAVKNRILDFSLMIEAENPEAGDGMPNSSPIPQEKLQPLVQNVFFGDVGAIAQNSEAITQSVNMAVSNQDLQRFVVEFAQHLNELSLDVRQQRRAEAQITAIGVELGGEPDPGIVRQAAKTLRNITEGAIASLIATAAQPAVWQWIHKVLTTLSK